jgi:bacterioferritin
MTGNDQVIDVLNEVLTGELTSVNQYFIHAKMCGNWGYQRLHKTVRAESIDEMRHAETLIDRILYLEGVPNVQRYWKVQVGQTVKEQLTLDLGIEKKAIELLNRAIELCRALGDHGSRDLLEKILVSEEGHADWLEAQLTLIDQVGEPNYLAQQIRPEG